ncbi:polyphosphate kinase 1 [Candidatus Poribacteria bacterium]|nr:polyphosphate kinase 1 [Candidatus Poribacteria bacterium]
MRQSKKADEEGSEDGRGRRFRDPSLYINRELSWIEFNGRVLGEARDVEKPLLERLKFVAIVSSNLDEFFMIRVAGVKRLVALNSTQAGPDGLTPDEQFAAISENCHKQVSELYTCLLHELLPALREEGISILEMGELTPEQAAWAEDYFHRQVFPVLTPLAIDPGHPFPQLRSGTLNLAIRLLGPNRRQDAPYFAVVQVPRGLSRFVRLPGGGDQFVLLEDVIVQHVAELFEGLQLVDVHPFCVTRDSDIEIDEEEGEDLLETIEDEIRKRDSSAVVRLDVTSRCSRDLVLQLTDDLEIMPDDIYAVEGLLRPSDLMGLALSIDRPDLLHAPFAAHFVSQLRGQRDIFAAIRERDILLHHPYESFEPVIRFVEQAADDPNVLAIKQTLYRTDGDSAIIQALVKAAQNGKQVTALVELKARFDERANITWARRLEEAGVHVVYGLVGLKTHCKLLLVVRREAGEERLRRYVHLGTGNYNSSTARLYTDLGLLTCNLQFGRDASRIFNILTGYSEFPQWRRLSVAPLGLRDMTVDLIGREEEHARQGRPARIIAKMNSVVDAKIIQALYRASCAGVEIDLIARGICCLRPGIPDVSERIRVRSIVGRFLEHSRIVYFHNNGDEEVYLSSADWMPRNFLRRVEVMFPIEDPGHRQRLIDEVLGLGLRDSRGARELHADGSYTWHREPIGSRVDSQAEFLSLAESQHRIHPLRPFSADFLLRQPPEF